MAGMRRGEQRQIQRLAGGLGQPACRLRQDVDRRVDEHDRDEPGGDTRQREAEGHARQCGDQS